MRLLLQRPRNPRSLLRNLSYQSNHSCPRIEMTTCSPNIGRSRRLCPQDPAVDLRTQTSDHSKLASELVTPRPSYRTKKCYMDVSTYAFDGVLETKSSALDNLKRLRAWEGRRKFPTLKDQMYGKMACPTIQLQRKTLI
jgi:hypothetical protein